MFEYAGGPQPHIAAARAIIATIGLTAFPEGPHRERMTALVTEAAAAEAVTAGTEAVYALLADEAVALSEDRRASMIEALGHLSRAALAWRIHGKAARWLALQVWAWAIHNGDEPPEAPEVDPEYTFAEPQTPPSPPVPGA